MSAQQPHDALDERFADWVDGRLDAQALAELEQEMAQDPELQKAAESYRATVQALQQHLGGEEQPPVDIAQAVGQRLAEPQPTRLRLLPVLASVAVAAAMLLMFLVLQPGSADSVQESAKNDAKAEAPASALVSEEKKSLARAMRGANEADDPRQDRDGFVVFSEGEVDEVTSQTLADLERHIHGVEIKKGNRNEMLQAFAGVQGVDTPVLLVQLGSMTGSLAPEGGADDVTGDAADLGRRRAEVESDLAELPAPVVTEEARESEKVTLGPVTGGKAEVGAVNRDAVVPSAEGRGEYRGPADNVPGANKAPAESPPSPAAPGKEKAGAELSAVKMLQDLQVRQAAAGNVVDSAGLQVQQLQFRPQAQAAKTEGAQSKQVPGAYANQSGDQVFLVQGDRVQVALFIRSLRDLIASQQLPVTEPPLLQTIGGLASQLGLAESADKDQSDKEQQGAGDYFLGADRQKKSQESGTEPTPMAFYLVLRPQRQKAK